MTKFKYAFFFIAVATTSNVAATTIFNTDFIHGMHPNSPEINNSYIDNTYYVDVYVNGIKTGSEEINIKNNAIKKLHLTKAWLSDANIKINSNFYAKCFDKENGYYILTKQKNTKIKFNSHENKLMFTIPQAGLVVKTNNSEWNEGNDSILFNYYLSSDKYNNEKINTTISSDFSINHKAWRLIGNIDSNAQNILPNVYLKRDIRSITSDLTVGKNQTNSRYLSSIPFIGIQLYNNNNMIPWSQRNYAPIISGSVVTAATITISQNGYIIKKLNINPGPYLINNLNIIGNSDIKVVIVDANGNKIEKKYAVGQMSTLLRPNSSNYLFSIGKANTTSNKLPFGEIEYSYGYNMFSTIMGSIISKKYFNILGGITYNLGFWGTSSLTNDFSYNKSINNHVGDKISVLYSKNINKDLQINFEYNKYKNNYYSFNDIGRISNDKLLSDIKIGLNNNVNYFKSNLAEQLWYNEYKQSYNYGCDFFITSEYKNIFLTTSLSYNKSSSLKDDLSLSFSLNIPLSSSFLSLSSNYINNGDYVNNINISQNITDNLNYSANVSQSQDDINSSINTTYLSDAAQFNGILSKTKYSSSASIQLSGTIIGVNDGENNHLLFSRNTNNTFAVIDTPNIKGISFNDSEPTNNYGLTINSLNSYQANTININTENIPNNIQFKTTSFTVTPTEGAIIFKKINYIKTFTYIFRIFAKNGMTIPFGSVAMNDKNQTLGYSQDKGIIIIRSHNDKNIININTGVERYHVDLKRYKSNLNTIQEIHYDK
ncbi:fimbria/pilus outer membrane usher protein [Photobacterium piscicola]|uniref:Fimbria/pilus outer membrane usher protein n=1 Tax=Photobacterium piscicola TaxID=1378299 RepID=A0ABU6LMV4_9GAMM|nr:fimbria/pilus outer membrane usher protein [Photobacterium piscicola]